MLNIIPQKEIQEKFKKPVVFVNLTKQNLDLITKREPFTIIAISLNIWNRIVQNKLKKVNPKAVAEYVDNRDPKIHLKISEIIKEPIIKDIIYSLGTVKDSKIKEKTVSQITIAHVFPNDLHLADVLFQNPYIPISKSDRKYRLQDFKGLGLLSTLIEKIEQHAKALSCDYITLTASNSELVPLFSKYGFTVEDNSQAKLATRVGLTIPMEKKIK